ncbi:MAG: Methyltransferase type 11 [Gemmatimonadetes bacterium]|nr:Methyltransferase type 11 [Gemmatimonadota bacterium]
MTDTAELARKVRELGPWFHDLEIHGVRTAPDHPLGNFLRDLWTQVEPAFPADMTGRTVLDIGCNGGFYSLQLHARGARVTAMDHDARYLEQARFAARELGADIEFHHLDVYDVETLGRRFDYVLFMGVFYHLRHPLLALERVARLPRERLVFQSMLRGATGAYPVQKDYDIGETAMFEDPTFPAMYFIEHEYAGDWTNWWVPNEAGMEAMLRSCGLRIEAHPAKEVYFCAPARAEG